MIALILIVLAIVVIAALRRDSPSTKFTPDVIPEKSYEVKNTRKRPVPSRTRKGIALEDADRTADSDQPATRVRRKSKARSADAKRLLFLDTETTGLGPDDRIVSLAIIEFDSSRLGEGKIELKFLHRIFNPERLCNPMATKIHGHSDYRLQTQPFFRDEAKEIIEFIGETGMIVCHNADFDLSFLNREFRLASMPQLNLPSFCTMKTYRKQYSGSAKLDDVVARFGMKRSGNSHGAFEDAWLAMNTFFFLHNLPRTPPISSYDPSAFKIQNFRDSSTT